MGAGYGSARCSNFGRLSQYSHILGLTLHVDCWDGGYGSARWLCSWQEVWCLEC